LLIDTKEIIQTKEVPRFNESGFIANASDSDFTQPFSYVALVELVKKSPEVIGILHALQTDICSDGFRFEGAKANIEKAENFASEQRFRSQFSGVILDWLMLGNGGLWRSVIPENDIKEVLRKVHLTTGVQVKDTELKAMIKGLRDEDVFKTKLLKHVPWSTMNIDLTKDKTSVRQFRQKLDTGDTPPIIFQPEEIIHGKFMEFDGKAYGFGPLESSVNVLSTLLLIKDLNGSFFVNGGVPDFMFILPKEQANSPNVRRLEQVLKKYKSSRKKHGNLVFTGEVDAQPLNKFDKDMEFRQMAIYYTGILALAFNMPMARVAAILGSEVKSNASATDLSEAGYWRGISSYQDYWEDLMNSQLWMPEFKVKIKFNRGYKNDQIKEAQRDVQQFEVLNKLALTKSIKPAYIKQKLHIPDDMWTGKFVPIEESSPFGGEGGSPGSSPKDTSKGDAQKASAGRKQEEAKRTVERKEFNGFFDVALPEFTDLFQNFVKLSSDRKVDYYEEGDNLVFFISTPEQTYRLLTGRSQISEVMLSEFFSFGRRVRA